MEVFYRSLKQTLEKRKMLSRGPAAATCELTWALFGHWLLQGLSAEQIVARGGDPLRWSAAKARDRVRQSLRRARRDRGPDRRLASDLAWTVGDTYTRQRSKKARNWPHKKKEKPPGRPRIHLATAKHKLAAKRLRVKMAPT